MPPWRRLKWRWRSRLNDCAPTCSAGEPRPERARGIRSVGSVGVRCCRGPGAPGRCSSGGISHSSWSGAMWCVPPVGRVFSPLDERLALLPTAYSPFLVEAIVRLGARLPFAQVAEEMGLLFGVSISADTVCRLTEQAGALQVTLEQRELERLEQEAPPEPAGPALQQVSADGAM